MASPVCSEERINEWFSIWKAVCLSVLTIDQQYTEWAETPPK